MLPIIKKILGRKIIDKLHFDRFLALSLEARYKLFHLLKITKGINTNSAKNKNLIISLTTYHKRFETAYLAIESLMHQTLKADKIILWLAKDELKNGQFPAKIAKLKSRGLDIRIVDENLKSYKKLIYALKEFPQSTIITCDDDVFYTKNFIKDLWRKSQEFPDCVVGYRCHTMHKTADGKLQPYSKWHSFSGNKPAFGAFATGVGGVLYPPNCLADEVFDSELFLKLAPTADDVWFKAMGLLKGTKTVMVYDKSTHFWSINIPNNDTLWSVNQFKNDEQIEQVFERFDLLDLIE